MYTCFFCETGTGTGPNCGLAGRYENFDEYTRRQYNAKAPNTTNPFGYDEEPKKFIDFDVFLKLRVLHTLTTWTFWNADRIRDKMPEKRETDQLEWVSRWSFGIEV
jgi:hypothetical protein